MKRSGFLTVGLIIMLLAVMTACAGPREVVTTAEGEKPQEEIDRPSVQETEEPVSEPPVQATDTELPESTDTPRSQLSLEIIDQNEYVSTIETLHFIGMLENTGNVDAEFVEVLVSIRDADGKLIDSAFSYSMLDVIRVGEKAPFSVAFFDAPENWETYEMVVQADEADFQDTYTDFEILSADGATSSIGTYEIDGEVRNIGDYDAEYVEIIAAMYDEEGKIIGVAFTFTSLDKIPSGASSPFSLNVFQTADGPVDHFDLWVQGSVID